jgi:P4 family phage/plasmid primase-like protien
MNWGAVVNEHRTTLQPDTREICEFLQTYIARVRAATKDMKQHPGVLNMILVHPDDDEVTCVYHYALDDDHLTERMTQEAIEASKSGHNVYVEARTVRRGLKGKQRGGHEDTVAVFALVVDSDRDKGAAWAPTVPVSLTVETSPGNAHFWFFFKHAIDRESGRTLGEQLRAITSADSDTGNICQPYRLAGTVNYPNQKKRERGRIVVSTRCLGCNPETLYTPERFSAEFPPAAAQPKPNGGGQANGASAANEASIPTDTMEAIRSSKTGGRGRILWNIVRTLREDGWTVAGIVALLERYPDGIAKKYKGRLQREIERVWDKLGDGMRVTTAGLEDAVALDFAAQHADVFRYVARTAQWKRWTGSRWQDEHTLSAFDHARALCRQAGDADAKVVAAVERLARSDRRIAATIEQWDTDADLLNAGTVTIDLKTGQGRPPNRLDYCTKQTSVDPAPPGTSCDLFLEFLDRVTGKDDELIGFLQRYLGYSLTGHVHEHVFGFLFGTGANGKGTFIRTIDSIFNDYCTVSPIEMFLRSKYDRHPTEVARLHKIRLTVAQETPKGRAWDESKIKNMTGGDVLTARFMRGDFFDFDPTHKIIIAGNIKPSLYNVDEAMRRRFLLIPFNQHIPERERDPLLSEKLRAEHPAILRWMIDGCLQWRQDGLLVPNAVRVASQQYFTDQDDITHWLEECTERKERCFTATNTLFKSWQRWCDDRGAVVGTQRGFTDALVERGLEYKRTENVRGFLNLALKAGGETQTEADFG